MEINAPVRSVANDESRWQFIFGHDKSERSERGLGGWHVPEGDHAIEIVMGSGLSSNQRV